MLSNTAVDRRGTALTRMLCMRPIIDPHHHLWQLGQFPFTWLALVAPPRPFGDHAPRSGTTSWPIIAPTSTASALSVLCS